MIQERITELISRYGLIDHPEGGYYKETFRAPVTDNERSTMSSIYYLLHEDNFSALHTIDANECWYHHEGGVLEIHTFHPEHGYAVKRLGSSSEVAEPFFIVPAGTVFGSCLADKNSYCLVSCAVAPAFEFEYFEINKRAELLERFPGHEEVIVQLTRG